MPTPLLIVLVLCLATCLLRAQSRDISHPGIGLGAFGALWAGLRWGAGQGAAYQGSGPEMAPSDLKSNMDSLEKELQQGCSSARHAREK